MTRGWKWMALGAALIAAVAAAEFKLHLIAKVQQEGLGKLIGVATDRLRKEGLRATIEAALGAWANRRSATVCPTRC